MDWLKIAPTLMMKRNSSFKIQSLIHYLSTLKLRENKFLSFLFGSLKILFYICIIIINKSLIMKMNPSNLESFRKDFKDAVKDLAEKYGVTIDIGSMTYRETQFTSRMTVRNKTLGGEDIKKVEFEAQCGLFGFKPSDYNRVFKDYKGDSYKLVGFNLRATKNPMKIVCLKSGTIYSCPKDYISF